MLLGSLSGVSPISCAFAATAAFHISSGYDSVSLYIYTTYATLELEKQFRENNLHLERFQREIREPDLSTRYTLTAALARHF